MRATPPCLMCMERHPACHDYCKNFLDFRKKKEEENKKQRRSALWEYKKDMVDKNLRKKAQSRR